nr:hypothetical protein [uncultured Solibaculum sp.]
MKATKRALIVSGFTLLVCFALLTGTTFAWLTDSVVNRGNKIQTGELKITASLYHEGEGGTTVTVPGYDEKNQDQVSFDQAGLDLTTSPEEDPLIRESDFGPGSTGIRMIQVSNGEDLSAKINFRFTVESDDLTDALWFDFIPIEKADSTEGGPVKTRELIKHPMAELTDVVSKQEFPLASEQTQSFLFLYGMDENAGGGYQGKKFIADVNILATQGGEEADGFGNTSYDQKASYDAITVTTPLQLDDALRVGGNIKLGEDIDMTSYDGGPWEVTKDTVLDLNQKQLKLKNGDGSQSQISVANGASFTLKNGSFTTADAGSPMNKAALESYGNLVLEKIILGGGNVQNLVQVEDGFLTMNSCKASTSSPGTRAVLIGIKGDRTEAALTNCIFEIGNNNVALRITTPTDQVHISDCTVNGQPMEAE